MADSVFDKKSRVRPPRVHITYEVETGGAEVMKEIPFVMGVLSDLSGQPKEKLAKLKDRKFVDIDRDNFDDALKSMKPRLAMRVDNTLADDGSELAVELNFEKLADFTPEGVVKQVEPLSKLQGVRNQLKDLLGRMEGNDRLEELLAEVSSNDAIREKLAGALGGGDGGDSEGSDDTDEGGDAPQSEGEGS